jgi:hypothetical protein
MNRKNIAHHLGRKITGDLRAYRTHGFILLLDGDNLIVSIFAP